ncbi:MAG TPA: outer membrane beta-barrel protein [Fibrobacteraceae bacterium]|nr:outer membrane beta-barrel protein [Fibrobacteraceae bacterium]
MRTFFPFFCLCAFPLFAQEWLYEEHLYLDSNVQVPDDSAHRLDQRLLEPMAPWMEQYESVKSDSALLSAPVDTLPTQQRKGAAAFDSTISDTGISISAEEGTPGFTVFQVIVYSADEGKPLEKAGVVVKLDTSMIQGETDANGVAILRGITAGERQVTITRKGFTPIVLDRVRFQAGKKLAKEFSMDRRIAKGKLIEVQKPKASASANLMAKRQQGAVVMEGVSAEQIAKSTDADAGAIAKRVTGTSVVGGKYVYVRGLGERYTNMTLNGLPVPSPEKDKRVVPQDLFPASALESFAIYKTFSPELPADFAGGSVALETKGFPDKDFYKVSVGLSATEYLGDGHFLDLYKDRLDPGRTGLSTTFGYESSDMEIPKGMPTIINSVTYPDAADRAALASQWNRRWSIDTAGMYPDQNYAVSMGKVWDAPGDGKAGFLANVSFKNDFTQNVRKRISVTNIAVTDSVTITTASGKERRILQIVRDTVDGEAQMLKYLGTGIQQKIEYGSYSTTLSGMMDWGYQNKNHILWFKTLYANLSQDVASYNYSVATPGVSTSQDNSIEERFFAEFSRRSVAVAQIGGGHYVGRSVLDSMSWAASLARSEGVVPDSRRYYYYSYDGSDLTFGIKTPYGTRQFQDFWENGIAARTDFYLVVPPEMSRRDLFLEDGGWLSRVRLPTVQSGFLFNRKTRAFDLVTYSWAGIPDEAVKVGDYSAVDEILDPDSVAAVVASTSTGFSTSLGDYDNYESTENSFATYANLEQNAQLFHIPTTLQAGARFEVYSLNFFAPFTSERAVKNPDLRLDSAKVIDQLDFEAYPALSVHFEFFPRTKTRLLWSRTLVRPEIRERAPTFFYDPVEEIEVIGNPDLKDTKIDNYDLRFEWFMPYQQMASVSLFYKNFQNPIEAYINANLSPNRKMFQNAKGGYVAGLELEADMSPGRWLMKRTGWSWVGGLGLYANASWMKSRVRIDTSADGADLLTSTNRPMVGQSPYLYNVKMTWESEPWGYKMLNALMYNIAGRRIAYLGVDDIPDTYEEPFGSLDYMLRFEFGRHTISLKVKNLLNAKQRYTVTEYNDTKHYVTISDARRDSLYSNIDDLQDVIEVSRVTPGIGLSLSYEMRL